MLKRVKKQLEKPDPQGASQEEVQKMKGKNSTWPKGVVQPSVLLAPTLILLNHCIHHRALCDSQLSSHLSKGVLLYWLLLWVMHAVSRHSLHPCNKPHSRLDYSFSAGCCFSSYTFIYKPLNKRHKAICKIRSHVLPCQDIGLAKTRIFLTSQWSSYRSIPDKIKKK